jgi:hypothetical protein
MRITLYNPDTATLENTFLISAVDEGTDDLVVENTDGFVADKAVMIGVMGHEKTELAVTDVVTDPDTITLTANMAFPHNADDPLYLMLYNQVRVYRAASENGSYSLIATVDIDVDNADLVTYYEDTTGSTTDYYKTKFYNSVTLESSDFSDPVPATGASALSIGSVIDGVVRRVRDTGYTVLGFQEYLDIAQEVNDDLISQMKKPYRWLKKSVALNTTLDVPYIDLDTAVTDFWKFNYLEYSWTSGGTTRTYQIKRPLSMEDFNWRYSSNSWANDDQLLDVALDEEENRILLGPTPRTSQTGVITLHYWRKFNAINSAGDLVMTPNSLIYRYKFMAEYYSAKAETDRQWGALAQKYEAKYGNEVVKMQRMNPLDVGTPRSFGPPRIPHLRKRFYL